MTEGEYLFLEPTLWNVLAFLLFAVAVAVLCVAWLRGRSLKEEDDHD